MSALPPSADAATDPIGPTLLSLVVPMLFGMLMIASVGIVDAYFIGQLGTEPLAAFGLCFPAVTLLQALLFGLANGITSALARVRGQRAEHAVGGPELVLIHTAIAMAVALASLLAAVGFALGRPAFTRVTDDGALVDLAMAYYGPFLLAIVLLSVPMSITAAMRGLGETRSSGLVMGLASLFNAGLDPVFMHGWGPLPQMGIAGASVATVVANAIGGLAAIVILLRTHGTRVFSRVAPHGGDAELPSHRTAYGTIAHVAGPAMVAQLLGPFASVVIATAVARQGTAALAALGIVQRVDMLVMIVSVATGAALMPLVGQSWGGGDRQRAALALRLGRRALVAYALLTGLLLNVFAGPLIGLFTDEPAVDAVVRIAFLLAPIGYVGSGLNISTMSCFNAIGSPMRATKLAAVFALVLLPALTAVGAREGVVGIFAGAAAASALSAMLGTRWMHLEGLTPRQA